MAAPEGKKKFHNLCQHTHTHKQTSDGGEAAALLPINGDKKSRRGRGETYVPTYIKEGKTLTDVVALCWALPAL